MPTLIIETNAPTPPDRRREILRAGSARVAEILGKPESYVLVLFRANPDMLFAGKDAPLAYLELKSLGLPEGQTSELSAALCDLMKTHLGITPERIYIEFASPPRHMFGWNGGTF